MSQIIGLSEQVITNGQTDIIIQQEASLLKYLECLEVCPKAADGLLDPELATLLAPGGRKNP